jgi:transketolase C-terminal domain/subunit
MNAQPILDAAAKANGTILTVEDNFTGGFNAALAEAAALTGQIKVHAMTCPRIPKSGKNGDIVLSSLGLGVDDIVSKAKSLA